MELSMSDTKTVSPLRQRMIEDMAARKLNPHTQRSHISSCKRFAAWLNPTGAALPVPTLRRPHDRDRGVRARLRAKLAPEAERGRHVVTQAYCERRDFPVPTRWLYAGSDLSRPDHGDQCAERPLMCSERWPRCPLRAPHLACPHIPIASWQCSTHHQGRR